MRGLMKNVMLVWGLEVISDNEMSFKGLTKCIKGVKTLIKIIYRRRYNFN